MSGNNRAEYGTFDIVLTDSLVLKTRIHIEFTVSAMMIRDYLYSLASILPRTE